MTKQDRARLWENLASRYGPERANVIIAGKDQPTLTDLRKWRGLGALPGVGAS